MRVIGWIVLSPLIVLFALGYGLVRFVQWAYPERLY